MAKIEKDVRVALRKGIAQFMKDKKLNWDTIQIPGRSIKKEFGCPRGWSTLHRVNGKEGSTPNTIEALLKFFGTPCTNIYGVITLTKTEENEA